MAEGRRKSFLCEPVEICDPGVGAIVGAKPGLSAFVSECLYFYCGPRVPGQCLSQADPQRHLTPWPRAGGQGGGRGLWPGDNYQRINGHFRRAGGGRLSIIVFPVWSGMFCGFWVGLGSVREEKWIIANFLSTVTWQLTLENWEIEPKEVREPGSLSRAWVFPSLHIPALSRDRRQEMKSIRCRNEERVTLILSGQFSENKIKILTLWHLIIISHHAPQRSKIMDCEQLQRGEGNMNVWSGGQRILLPGGNLRMCISSSGGQSHVLRCLGSAPRDHEQTLWWNMQRGQNTGEQWDSHWRNTFWGWTTATSFPFDSEKEGDTSAVDTTYQVPG